MTKTGPTRRAHTFYVILLTCLTLVMALPGLAHLPVIDRDEARYAQATVQMVDSGDYLNIRFQDEARNKKPAGIYWMQAASVKAFSEPGERKIWAHRLPSVLGALIAVLATYWGGVVMLGRRGAFYGAAVLAVAGLFVFEAHVAKTDAMLCGMCAVMLATLLHLRVRDSGVAACLLWVAMGWGVMIKGPIAPALLGLTLITLAIWERKLSWMKRLISWPGIIFALILTVPWAAMIWIETDGAFFKEAIGVDLGPKLVSGQESHGAPPGYYLLTLAIWFFPGTLVLVSGLYFAWKTLRSGTGNASNLPKLTRLLVAWILPFWILLEIVPTKLPNYLLPIYPALSLLCGGAILALLSIKTLTISRRIGSLLCLLVGLALIVGVLAVDTVYAELSQITIAIASLSGILLFAGVVAWWVGHTRVALGSAVMAIISLSGTTYQSVLPRAKTLQVSYAIEGALVENKIRLPRNGGGRILSPQFTEPSLVYRLGANIVLGDRVEKERDHPETNDIWIFDKLEDTDDKWQENATSIYGTSELCFDIISNVSGLNYAKGDEVEIEIAKAIPCLATGPLDPDEAPTTTPDP